MKNHKHKGLKTSKNIVSTHQEKYIGKKIFCFEVHADNVEGGMPGHCDRGLTAQHFFKWIVMTWWDPFTVAVICILASWLQKIKNAVFHRNKKILTWIKRSLYLNLYLEASSAKMFQYFKLMKTSFSSQVLETAAMLSGVGVYRLGLFSLPRVWWHDEGEWAEVEPGEV